MEPADISYRRILRVAFPMMISGISMTVVNLTDTMFLSRLGTAELGGAGNAGLFYFLMIIVAMGFSTGAQIIISRRNGERNYTKIGSVVQHTVAFLFGWGILILAFILLFLPELLSLIIQSADIADVMERFLRIRAWGIFFNISSVICIAFLVGTTQTRIIGVITPLTAILNIVLDYLLIFGKIGLPEMGVEGAALASNIAEGFGVFLFIWYILSSVDHNKYTLFQWQGIDQDRSLRLLKTSAPLTVQNGVSFLAWLAFFTVIEHMGEKELAVSHMIRSMYMVLIIPVFGLGDATSTLTGNLMGSGHTDRVMTMVGRVLMIGIGIVLCLQPVFYVFGSDILLPFTSDPELLKMGYPVLWIVFTALFFFTLAISGFRTISGAGRTMTALYIEVITVAVYIGSAAWLATMPGAELYHVWAAEFIYFGIFATMVYAYLWKGNWKTSQV
jgi:putative MATE family efflux protein